MEVSPCTADFLGVTCTTNLCFFLSTLTMGISTSTCPSIPPSNVSTSCTDNSQCTPGGCTSCMNVQVTAPGSAPIIQNVCMSAKNGTCASMNAVISFGSCKTDSFGMPYTCCDTYTMTGNNLWQCSTGIGSVLSPQATSVLKTWSATTRTSMLLIGTMTIIAAWMI